MPKGLLAGAEDRESPDSLTVDEEKRTGECGSESGELRGINNTNWFALRRKLITVRWFRGIE